MSSWNPKPEEIAAEKAGYARGMEDAAKICDSNEALYGAYAEQGAKDGDISKEALMRGHALTARYLAIAIRAAKERK